MLSDPDFTPGVGSKKARSRPPIVDAWIGVYLANLPVPLWFALALTQNGGRVGMTIAVVLMLALGALVVSRFRKAGLAVVIGGWIVAVSQLAPLLQIYAGSIGVFTALGGSQNSMAGLRDEPGGFVATIVTGGLLIAVALAIGATLLLVRAGFKRWNWGRHAKPAKQGSLDF